MIPLTQNNLNAGDQRTKSKERPKSPTGVVGVFHVIPSKDVRMASTLFKLEVNVQNIFNSGDHAMLKHPIDPVLRAVHTRPLVDVMIWVVTP